MDQWINMMMRSAMWLRVGLAYTPQKSGSLYHAPTSSMEKMPPRQLTRQQISSQLKQLYTQGDYLSAEVIFNTQKYSWLDSPAGLNWLLSLKTNYEYRFRKYEQIYTNIDNQLFQIRMDKFPPQEHPRLLMLLNSYLLIAMIHDVSRVERALMDRSGDGLLVECLDKYFQLYKGHEKCRFQCAYTLTLAYAAIGLPSEAVQIINQHINHPQNQPKQRDLLVIALLTIVSSTGLAENTSQNAQFPQFLNGESKIEREWDKMGMGPEYIQDTLNLLLCHKKPKKWKWSDIPPNYLRRYYRLLYMLAENYYISGNIPASLRVAQSLQSVIKTEHQNKQAANIALLLKYFLSIRLYDNASYQQCLKLYDEDIHPIHPSTASFRDLYLYNIPEMDIVRRNMYSIALRAKESSKAETEETELIIKAYEAILNVGEFKQKEGRRCIAHYYFLLPHEELFRVRWEK